MMMMMIIIKAFKELVKSKKVATVKAFKEPLTSSKTAPTKAFKEIVKAIYGVASQLKDITITTTTTATTSNATTTTTRITSNPIMIRGSKFLLKHFAQAWLKPSPKPIVATREKHGTRAHRGKTLEAGVS